MTDNNIIQFLWVGNSFSTVEHLSLKSFLMNGYECHLYCYNDIENVPEGVKIKDANEIILEKDFHCYKESGSPSLSSNHFRFKLLFERGNAYSDCDIICLKRFDDIAEPFIFVSEEVLPLNQNNTHEGSCFLRLPQGSLPAKTGYDICSQVNPETAKHGVGPKCVKQVVNQFNLHSFVKKPEFACPSPGCLFQLYLNDFDEGLNKYINENTYMVHIWLNMTRNAKIDMNQQFHPNSFIEQMKRKYEVK